MIGGIGVHLSKPPPSAARRRYPPLSCALTKQGQRFLTSLATAEEPSSAIRKFVASSNKHVALTTLSHLLSHPHLSSLTLPLYSVIEQESWFVWNAKLVGDLIALLYNHERFDEAEDLCAETVLKLGSKERDLCLFYCNLVDSHAKSKSQKGVLDTCKRLRELVSVSSSVYVKQKGYESMIDGLCEVGFPDQGEDLVNKVRGMGLKSSVFMFRSLIYGYGQMGLLEDMKRSVVRMENEGFELDTVCCNMVLSSFGAHGELLDMVLWLRKMRSSGISFSIRSYNSVLNSCPTVIFLLEDLKNLPLSINELMENLKEDEANLVGELLESPVLNQVMEWKSSEMKLDLHGMHLGTAYLVLLQWFDELKVRLVDGNHQTPTEVMVVCGCGKHSSTRGESPVKGLTKEIIMRTNCPLRIDRKNVGCFICKGKKFKDWLCHADAVVDADILLQKL